MHTRFDIAIAGLASDKIKMTAIVEQCRRAVENLEMLGSRFNTDSALYKHCRTGSPMPLELVNIMDRCLSMTEPTMGYFNVLHDGEVPDLGGFLKGYAAQHIKEILLRENISDALINAGDSSIVAMGDSPIDRGGPGGDSAGWNITTVTSHRLSLKDCALSISGRHPDGSRHIVDPHTGMLVDGPIVGVTGPEADVCEVLSTALYAAPDCARQQIIQSFPGYHFSTY
ncbi:MAG: FAD:protein FMN transferase [Clostridiales bacterium]|nr:FAD:protein FMN transferase [Clostridiales bacterium]